MSVLDLHPEDLLDREASGVLTPAERAMLDAHLANCSACRLERMVRADFAADMDADDASASGALLVTRALENAGVAEKPAKQAEKAHADVARDRHEDEANLEREEEEEEDPIVVRRTSVRARRIRRRAGAFVIAAAVLMLASVAVAARGTHVFAVLFAPAETVEEAPKDPPPAPAKPKKKSHAVKQVARPADPENAQEEDDTTSQVEETPAPVAPTACAPVPVQPAPQAILVRTTPSHDVAPATSAVVNASAMFSDANAARRRGDHGAAIVAYRDLLAKYASSPEAGPTRVALGRMLLDDGDAASALPLFDRYVADGDGALREEAMLGRARSLQRLGRADEERAAWQLLLQSYPQSIHSARAEARIEELKPR